MCILLTIIIYIFKNSLINYINQSIKIGTKLDFSEKIMIIFCWLICHTFVPRYRSLIFFFKKKIFLNFFFKLLYCGTKKLAVQNFDRPIVYMLNWKKKHFCVFVYIWRACIILYIHLYDKKLKNFLSRVYWKRWLFLREILYILKNNRNFRYLGPISNLTIFLESSNFCNSNGLKFDWKK